MGRSVGYANGSVYIAYETFEYENGGEGDLGVTEEWNMFLEDVIFRGEDAFKSLTQCDEWLGAEDHALLENEFCYIGVSEYCGLVSIWLTPKDADCYTRGGWENVRDHWIGQVGPKFNKVFGTLRKLGSFSNGEGVYERKELVTQ